MPNYTKSGYFGYAGGGKNGAIVDMWAASRFSVAPAQDSAPPTGSPDGGPVTTGINFGGPGGYLVTVTVLQDYWQRVQYGGHSYWSAVSQNTLQGAPYPAGPTGPPGPTGPTGPTGPAGTPFSLVYTSFLSGTTWSASGTQPVIGNGTITARYATVGKMVSYYIDILMGSTTTYGTGTYQFLLPVAAANAVGWQTAQAVVKLAAGTNYLGSAPIIVNAGSTNVWILGGGSSTVTVLSNSFSLTTGDHIVISGTYESV